MSRAPWVIVALVLLCAVAAPRAAQADFPRRAFYVGLDGGGIFRLGKWDLGEATTVSPGFRGEGMGGLRFGVHLLPQFAAELELAYIPLSHLGARNTMISYDLNLLFHVLKTANWSPTFEFGFGAYSNVSGNLGLDTDPRVHVGIGVRGLVTRWMALRADARDVITDGFGNGTGNNVELTAGLDFFLWVGTPGPTPVSE
ncbi:MAG TPA: outer membrane beta-barrel protein [Polyangia bacterium]|jgi:hypothetical protein